MHTGVVLFSHNDSIACAKWVRRNFSKDSAEYNHIWIRENKSKEPIQTDNRKK